MRLPIGWIAFVALLLPASLVAQAQQARPRLRLFLDCATDCDKEYLRAEVKVVDWVTDKNASDIYVLATSLENSAGGDSYVLAFTGRGGVLEGMTDRFTFETAPDATDDEVRVRFARVLRLGLVRYLLTVQPDFGLTVQEGGAGGPTSAPITTIDRWDHWVFNLQLDGQYDAESREKGTEIELQLNASRITDDWKIASEFTKTIDRNSYILDDGSKYSARKDRWNALVLVGKSLGPQWSIGVESGATSSRPDNLDLSVRVGPAIEYDLFPYAEAQRRRMILQYVLSLNHFDYAEETVYDRLQETRLEHRFRMEYRTRQPWGGASVTGTANVFAHDLSKSRLGIDGSFTVRVAKGFGVEVEGSYSKVRNQLALPKGDATDEEIFLDLRERATAYQASLTVGLSYTFGSFLNSIVNPRFNNLQP